MKFAKPYNDLREFIAALDEAGKLYRIHKEINKDTELQPLVRWQFRGLPEEARKGFLFDNVTDTKKGKYNCSVLVGGLADLRALLRSTQEVRTYRPTPGSSAGWDAAEGRLEGTRA